MQHAIKTTLLRQLQYGRKHTTCTCCYHHKRSTIHVAVGLASCLWLLRDVTYAAAMNKVNSRIYDNGDRPVYIRTASFLPQGRSYESVARYMARVGLSVHENAQGYCEATDLLSTDSKTAGFLSFCVATVIAYRTSNGS